ncbi:DUF3822 family protein [Paracnuella aquatica]|uniref:DUF3822 family protein n=1 Tax=Paracnuella aquatica TaxID=2268757 RepID=UPI000DEEBA3A|nr:DUF3822 family protein [Paracnuella aquatica]RPD51358.1 DUF3822 family protein [Paracnuella aquatica]
MKTLFESGRLSVAPSETLLMELGTEYCLLSKMDPETGAPAFARLYAFPERNLQAALESIVGLVKESAADDVHLVASLAFPQAAIVPEANGVAYPQMLQALFPGSIGRPATYVNGKTYAFHVPPAVHQVLGKHFRSVEYRPAIACVPEGDGEANSIHVFFVDHQIRVAVYKQHQLQLVQQYSFQVPLDVVYYLLKICTEFSLSQQETLVSVSGFIEAVSPLYKELHQYFLNIRFSPLQSVDIDGQPVPQYYFSSLYNLAQCAL